MLNLTPEEEALIRERRKQKAASEFAPKEWTDGDKIEAFDKLRDMALSHYEDVKKNGGGDHTDAKHYMFEGVMELLGKDVWTSYNQFQR